MIRRKVSFCYEGLKDLRRNAKQCISILSTHFIRTSVVMKENEQSLKQPTGISITIIDTAIEYLMSLSCCEGVRFSCQYRSTLNNAMPYLSRSVISSQILYCSSVRIQAYYRWRRHVIVCVFKNRYYTEYQWHHPPGWIFLSIVWMPSCRHRRGWENIIR